MDENGVYHVYVQWECCYNESNWHYETREGRVDPDIDMWPGMAMVGAAGYLLLDFSVTFLKPCGGDDFVRWVNKPGRIEDQICWFLVYIVGYAFSSFVVVLCGGVWDDLWALYFTGYYKPMPLLPLGAIVGFIVILFLVLIIGNFAWNIFMLFNIFYMLEMAWINTYGKEEEEKNLSENLPESLPVATVVVCEEESL